MRSRVDWSEGLPRISIVPASAPRMSMTMRSVVVLPAPFGPSRPNTLPRGIARERSLTATWPAKDLVTPDSRMALSLNCVIIGPTMTGPEPSRERGSPPHDVSGGSGGTGESPQLNSERGSTPREGGGGSGGASESPQLNSERGSTPRERDDARGLFYVVVSTVAYGSLPILAKLAFAAGVRTTGLL